MYHQASPPVHGLFRRSVKIFSPSVPFLSPKKEVKLNGSFKFFTCHIVCFESSGAGVRWAVRLTLFRLLEDLLYGC